MRTFIIVDSMGRLIGPFPTWDAATTHGYELGLGAHGFHVRTVHSPATVASYRSTWTA